MGMSNEELLNSLQQMIDTAEKRMAEMSPQTAESETANDD